MWSTNKTIGGEQKRGAEISHNNRATAFNSEVCHELDKAEDHVPQNEAQRRSDWGHLLLVTFTVS